MGPLSKEVFEMDVQQEKECRHSEDKNINIDLISIIRTRCALFVAFHPRFSA